MTTSKVLPSNIHHHTVKIGTAVIIAHDVQLHHTSVMRGDPHPSSHMMMLAAKTDPSSHMMAGG